MKQHLQKSERVRAGGAKFATKAPKKKFLKNHPDVKYNPNTRRYE